METTAIIEYLNEKLGQEGTIVDGVRFHDGAIDLETSADNLDIKVIVYWDAIPEGMPKSPTYVTITPRATRDNIKDIIVFGTRAEEIMKVLEEEEE